ncbi:MAG: fimbrillin family protein [Muribaculaceae bacterium]|nr:fimbrillin family protein [Muribaculaceae bacterium]
MKKIFLLATTALALAACSNDDNYVDRPVAAQFTATIGQSNVSRVSGSSWDKNDMIGITTTFNNQVGPFINMRYTTAEGDGAFAGNTIYIYNPMSLTAYYPFAGDEGTAPKEQGVISAVTDAEHQQPENQKKIDFLFASKAEITTDDANVALEFSHKMSKLTFIFIDGKGADVSKISAYKIEGLALEGSFDTATGVCAAKSDVATLSM